MGDIDFDGYGAINGEFSVGGPEMSHSHGILDFGPNGSSGSR